MGRVDGYPPSDLFRCFVDLVICDEARSSTFSQNLRDGRRESCFPMIDMSNCADIAVDFRRRLWGCFRLRSEESLENPPTFQP